MNEAVRRELVFPQSREVVWNAIASREALAAWMYPNDFEARLGHQFTFQVPAKPEVGFEGLTVACEVIVCAPPAELAFTWVAGGIDTVVRYRLESGEGVTILHFEQTGFTPSQQHARMGAEYGWRMMHEALQALVSPT